MKRASFKGLAVLALGAGLALATLPTPALAGVVPMPSEAASKVDDNYWAELGYYKDASLHPSRDPGKDGYIIPAYLENFFNTSAAKWTTSYEASLFDVNMTLMFPSAGIREGGAEEGGQKIDEMEQNLLQFMVWPYSMKPEDQGGAPLHPAHPQYDYWKDGRFWLPYGLDEHNDLIGNGQSDYNVYGDLTESGASSTAVAAHKAGDTVNLTLTEDLSMFRNMMNVMLVSAINSEWPAQELMKRNTPENGLAISDAELVFVIDLPEGLEATDETAFSLDVLDDFALATEKENDGKRLVVHARVQQPDAGYEKLKDLYAKINSLNLNSIALHVNGLKVTDEAPVDTVLTATGYAYGGFDWVMSSADDAIVNRDASLAKDNGHQFGRAAYVFAAKQGDATRDAAADPAKPNLMTYSFQVPAPALHAVTFVSDGAEVAKVNVEDGKGIATDGLADQSMPADPTKDGYTFKGWNTAADGTGEAFTGETAVGSDMTVYAVFEKTPAPAQPSKPAKPARKVEKLPQTGDAGLLAASAVTAAAGGAVLLASWKTRDKS